VNTSGKRRFVSAALMAMILAAAAMYAYQNYWHRMLVYYLYARMHQGGLIAADALVQGSDGESVLDIWQRELQDASPEAQSRSVLGIKK